MHDVSAGLGHGDLRTTARCAPRDPNGSTMSPRWSTAATTPPGGREGARWTMGEIWFGAIVATTRILVNVMNEGFSGAV